MFKLHERRVCLLFILGVAVLLRLCIGLHSYSGASVAPRFGDYEAQRHWMEVTVNLPVGHWYANTTDNDLDYWGLDYPPLSAYQSWLYGKVLRPFEPRAFELRRSRGYESGRSKLLLRWSVVASDLLVYFPAVLAGLAVFGQGRTPACRAAMATTALLQPAAVLIDHGHFQYNNICLGLAAGAAAAVADGRHLLGSCLFCLALNHKQMALYFAPAFFAHLLGCALQLPTLHARALRICKLGAVVVATFAVCWAPFLAKPARAGDVLRRLAPLGRGLYEDYVANFWCSTSALVKWRQLFSQQVLVRACACCTLSALLPAALAEAGRPSPQGLLRCMAASSFAFFLFAYQVHEKSILLPLLPLTLLDACDGAGELALRRWMPAMAAFSMSPLLKKDRLMVAYVGAIALWAAVAWPLRPCARAQNGGQAPLGVGGAAEKGGGAPMGVTAGGESAGTPLGVKGAGVAPGSAAGRQQAAPAHVLEPQLWSQLAVGASVAGTAVLQALGAVVTPPPRLPYLFDLLVTAYSFAHFAAAAAWLNMRILAHARTPLPDTSRL